MADDHDEGTDRYEWERIIRRVRLGAPTKAVALAMATYADRNGSRVYPGVARLAAVTELSERSVRSALKKLRQVGLIQRTVSGGHRGVHSYADVHRLTIPADLFDVLEVLNTDESLPSQPAHPAAWDGSQPAPGAAQPAGGAAQPAPDDTPTGTRCTPPVLTNHTPTHRPTDHSLSVTEVQNARADAGENVIALNVGGGRR